MEAVFGSEFCFLKRKEPFEVIRNNAILARIPKANGHTGVEPRPQRQWVLDESDMCWWRMA